MVFGDTGMDDKEMFIRAANGEDIISDLFPNMTLQNLRKSPMMTASDKASLPKFALVNKKADGGAVYKSANGDTLV